MNLDEFYTLSRQYLITKNKAYQRDLFKKNTFKHRLNILVGARGVGKTTLMIQELLRSVEEDLSNPNVLYVPADHFLLGDNSLYDIAEQFYQTGGQYIGFDEIHKYSDWSKELKSIYDTFPNLKIIASGSSALKIHQGSHDLTRRAVVYSIKGLSFREYLELNLQKDFSIFSLTEILKDHEKISIQVIEKLNHEKRKILAEFKYYLKTGYYPYYLEFNDENIYSITLEQNFHAIIESDLPAVYPHLTGNSIKKIKQLLIFIASSSPFFPNFNKLKNLLDIGDIRTLKTYFKYLEDAELIRSVMKASTKLNQLEAPKKIFLDNPNQYYAMASGTEKIGAIRELFFLSMLSHMHQVTAPKAGDFLIDGNFLFEIGGKKKDFNQIKLEKDAYLACDDLEIGINNKIPLWLFGFLY